jgi:hypothetical protein
MALTPDLTLLVPGPGLEPGHLAAADFEIYFIATPAAPAPSAQLFH